MWTSSAAKNDSEGEKERPGSGVIGRGVENTGSEVIGSGVETLSLQLATPCRSEPIEIHTNDIAYFWIAELREQVEKSFLQDFLEGTNSAVRHLIWISLSFNHKLCLPIIHLSGTTDFFNLCCFANGCDKANFILNNENGHRLVEGSIEIISRRRANIHYPHRTRTSLHLQMAVHLQKTTSCVVR